MTGWPRFLVMTAVTARATTSVALPGVKGTMMWTGLSGQVCALAGKATGKAASKAATTKTIRRCIVTPRTRQSACRSKSEADAGQHEQQVDSQLELLIREPLENVQPQPGAGESGGNEVERLPVQLRHCRRRGLHELDDGQAYWLHAKDERLIDATLAGFVPALEPAPDRNGGTGKACETARKTADKSHAGIRKWPRAQRPCWPFE